MVTSDDLNKTDFDEIYDQPDPRQYYATLEPFEYVIPASGADMFDQLVQARAKTHGANVPGSSICVVPTASSGCF